MHGTTPPWTHGRFGAATLWLPAGLVLGIFFLLPMLVVLTTSFEAGWEERYLSLVSDEYFHRTYVLTLQLSLAATVLSALVSYPLVLYMIRVGPTLRSLLFLIVLGPLLLSIVVRTLGWTILFGPTGVVNQIIQSWGNDRIAFLGTRTIVVVAMVHAYYGLMVLNLYAGLSAIPSDLIQAATTLGSNGWTVFRRIIFPLSLPSLASGATLVFVSSATAFVTPSILGAGRIRTTPMVIVEYTILHFKWAFASAMGIGLLLMILVFTVLINRAGKRWWV